MPPEFVKFLETISAFLEPCCDVSVHEALIVACERVFGLWGDDDPQVLGLVLDFDLNWWVEACECGRIRCGFEVDSVGGIGSEKFTLAQVEFEVVL